MTVVAVATLVVAATTAVGSLGLMIGADAGHRDGGGQTYFAAAADPDAGSAVSTDRAATVRADTSTRSEETSSASQAVAVPDRLIIPSLVVDAAMQATGVTASGDARIPRDGDRVGWYEFGPRPGDSSGSAVVIGHRDTMREGPGALFELDDLRPGALVTVRAGDDGYRYRVVELHSVEKQALPDSLFRRAGAHQLVIVTCGGAYLPDAGGYQENLYAIATPVGGRR